MAGDRSAEGGATRRWGIAIALIGLGVLAAALVMLAVPATLTAGTVVIAFGPSLVAGGRMLARSAVRSAPPGAGMRLAAIVLLPVAVLGVIGLVERADPDYTGRYGTPVTASPASYCTVHTTVNFRNSYSFTYTACPVLYRLDGDRTDDYRIAEVVAAEGEVILGADSVDIYVLDGHAETRARVGAISPTVVLGRYLPGWLLFGTLAEAVLLVLLLRRAWVRFTRDDPPKPQPEGLRIWIPQRRLSPAELRRKAATRSRRKRLGITR